MRKAIRVSLRVPVEIRQENSRFIATCFLLDFPQEAPSKHGVIERIANAVQMYLLSRFNDRTIDTFLDYHDLDVQQVSSGIVEYGPYIDVSVMLEVSEPQG